MWDLAAPTDRRTASGNGKAAQARPEYFGHPDTSAINRLNLLGILAAAASVFNAGAAGSIDSGATPRQASVPAPQPEYTMGEIKSVDREHGAVIVKHGPIRHLGMPDMTMRFRLVDTGRASSLRSGDVVRFHAEKHNGMLVITDVARL